MKIFSTVSMFCCVLKSSDCHIIYSTYIPSKYLVWEVWEAFNFPAGSGDGTAWQGAWEKWLDTKTQVCSSELHRNPHTDGPNWIKIRKPWDFCTALRWQKKEFPALKGWFHQYPVAPFWTEHKSTFPTSKSCRGEVKPELFDDCLICALSKAAFL